MIKLTRMDGSEVYVNCELIAFVEEVPDTRITLTNGNIYLFRESAKEVIGRIVMFKARILRHSSNAYSKRYLQKSC